jgi:hypothetical protein
LGNEDLQCTFLNKFGFLPEIDSLFRDHAVAWGDAILDDLLHIYLYTPHGTTTMVDLVFRDDARHDFIGELRPKCFRPPPSMRDYLRTLGDIERSEMIALIARWEVGGIVEFVVSKQAANALSGRHTGNGQAFETQYRLMQS